MHTSAMQNCKAFFEAYGPTFAGVENVRIIEIGSQDVNGSLRKVAPPEHEYVGVDFVEGKGVDVILEDPYVLPFEDGSADIMVSSSCFEHSDMFWLVYLEIMRVLKPHGIFYLNAPSNGYIHRYPIDAWRFYPDSGKALVTWARRNGMQAALLESYVSLQTGHQNEFWNDFVAVFLKDEANVARHPRRILDSKKDFANGFRNDSQEPLKPSMLTENQKKLQAIANICSLQIRVE